MLNPSLQKNSCGTIEPIDGADKGIHTFSKGHWFEGKSNSVIGVRTHLRRGRSPAR